jgi:hypothetical protein
MSEDASWKIYEERDSENCKFLQGGGYFGVDACDHPEHSGAEKAMAKDPDGLPACRQSVCPLRKGRP